METALASLALGMLSTMSPCVLPLYPGFLAYLAGQGTIRGARPTPLLGLVVLLGVMSTMLAVGAVIALLAVPISRTLAILIPIADALILLLGIALLLDRNPFAGLPQVAVPLVRGRYINAYLYGALYGPIALPCSGPLVVGIFALSLTVGEAIERLWVFAWFGLGFGLPLLVLSLLSGPLQHRLTTLFAVHRRLANTVGGFLLITVAIYDLWRNWALLVDAWS